MIFFCKNLKKLFSSLKKEIEKCVGQLGINIFFNSLGKQENKSSKSFSITLCWRVSPNFFVKMFPSQK